VSAGQQEGMEAAFFVDERVIFVVRPRRERPIA
jgi:hypothetical protein